MPNAIIPAKITYYVRQWGMNKKNIAAYPNRRVKEGAPVREFKLFVLSNCRDNSITVYFRLQNYTQFVYIGGFLYSPAISPQMIETYIAKQHNL